MIFRLVIIPMLLVVLRQLVVVVVVVLGHNALRSWIHVNEKMVPYYYYQWKTIKLCSWTS